MKGSTLAACLFFCLLAKFIFPQSRVADSVFARLKTEKTDSIRFILYYNLNEEQAGARVFPSFIDSCFSIAKRLSNEKYTAYANNKAGNYFSNRGENKKALGYYLTSADICKRINNKKHLSGSYNNAANCYDILGIYDKALYYYFESLKIKEETGQKENIYVGKLNIATVYYNLKQYEQSIAYCYEALPDAVGKGDKDCESKIYHNLGNNYSDLKNWKKAEECYLKAIAIAESDKDDYNISNSTMGLADVYMRTGDYRKAQFYAERSMALARANDFSEYLAAAVNGLGLIFIHQKKFSSAEENLLEGLKISQENQIALELKSAYEYLSLLYEEQKRPVEALKYYKLFSAVKDSLINDNKTQLLSNLQENYEIEKQQQQNQILKVQNDISSITIREQKRFSIVVVIALILTAGLTFFVFRGLRKQRHANTLISAQKREVEQQKQLLDEKQREILDSIHYARRIQQSLLPSEKYIHKNLKKLEN